LFILFSNNIFIQDRGGTTSFQEDGDVPVDVEQKNEVLPGDGK
jgi:hypothetical protein